MDLRMAAAAEEDIEHARLHLNTESPGIGDRFHADVLDTLRYVLLHPKGFQVRNEHFRHTPLSTFRYVVIYSIEADHIVVHMVWHMHRRTLKNYFGA